MIKRFAGNMCIESRGGFETGVSLLTSTRISYDDLSGTFCLNSLDGSRFGWQDLLSVGLFYGLRRSLFLYFSNTAPLRLC